MPPSHSDKVYIKNYKGRFAPSPTGPLHLGSLLAAVISYLEAHKQQGKWFVRIENIDPLREQKNSRQEILDCLIAHGLFWDDDVIFQSDHSKLYERTLQDLFAKQLTYHCPCSRKELNHNQGRHTKACLQKSFDNKSFAIKFKSADKRYQWNDLIRGDLSQQVEDDFVLKRKEGYYAYQLAVVCDDIAQGISHVVRGADLLTSTPSQLALFEALDKAPPKYSHFPVIVNSHGQKLSKQNFAPELNPQNALKNLQLIFKLLDLKLPKPPRSPEEALLLALPVWDIHNIPAKNIIINTNHFTTDASKP